MGRAGLGIVAGDGSPEAVCATEVVAAHLEDLQFTLGEGPGVEAVRSGDVGLEPTTYGVLNGVAQPATTWSLMREDTTG